MILLGPPLLSRDGSEMLAHSINSRALLDFFPPTECSCWWLGTFRFALLGWNVPSLSQRWEDRMGRTPRCELWPNCGCYETLALWKRNIVDDQESLWRKDELEWAESAIFISLACMVKHCPDKGIRAYAKRQLQDRFWDRQWSMSIREQ